MLELTQRSCLYEVYDQIYESLYTNGSDFHFLSQPEGQVYDSGLIGILDIEKFGIDTFIKFIVCLIQPEQRQVFNGCA